MIRYSKHRKTPELSISNFKPFKLKDLNENTYQGESIINLLTNKTEFGKETPSPMNYQMYWDNSSPTGFSAATTFRANSK